MSGPNIVRQIRAYGTQEFLSNHVLSVEHNFQTDGKPASWLPQHPKQWGSEITRIELPGPTKPTYIDLSDDDSRLAIGIGNNIHVYTIKRSGPNGDQVLLQQKKILHSDQGDGSILFLEFQPGSNDILLSCRGTGIRENDTISVWDMELEQKELESNLTLAAEAADNAALQVLSQQTSLRSFNIQNFDIASKFEGTLRAAQLMVLQGTAKYQPFSHNGSFFLAFPDKTSVAIIAVDGFHEQFRLLSHQDYVTWAEYGPDDGIIATASWDRTVRIWNAVNGALIHTLTGPTGQIWSAAFSPDGKLIAAGGDHQVRLWSVESGKLLHTLSGYDDTCRTRSLCFSPDGATLAAGARGGTLRLFSILTGECLQHWQTGISDSVSRPPGFSDPGLKQFLEASNVQYTVQGLLVFRTVDGRKFTFDARTNQKGLFEHGPNVVGSLGAKNFRTSSDGNLLFTIDFDGFIRIWAL